LIKLITLLDTYVLIVICLFQQIAFAFLHFLLINSA